MAATLITSRPSATLVALAALLAVLALTAVPVTASQLNFYAEEGCNGGIIQACFDGTCCAVPSDAASIRFYYNPFSKGYLFNEDRCTGSVNSILAADVPCRDGVDFVSAILSDSEPRLLGMKTDH